MYRDHEAVREETARQLEKVQAEREEDRRHRKKMDEMRETTYNALQNAQHTERLLPETGREPSE